MNFTIFFSVFGWFLLYPFQATGGPYLNSAHGNSSAGVNRSGMEVGTGLGYARGNCAHCHEQHRSIGGTEPAPAGGPYQYTLFYKNYDSFATPVTICFQCHDDVGAIQTEGGIFNYSYSYRAGGWTADTVNDIPESFGLASHHNLDNILTFIQTQAWGYTANSNPCVACHDPHAAQGDPINSSSTKSSGTRGWPLSRPSEHANSPWPLWGDDVATESMWNYAGVKYQAPYRFNTTSFYEPQGDAIATPQQTVAENTTDFVTFCTDCHNVSNVIYSDNLGRNLRTINWASEKHGGPIDADTSLCGDNPYPSGTSGLGNGLSCLDCHESHGSPNAFLIRAEVNGAVLGATIGSFGSANWHYLCDCCHQDDQQIDASCQNDHYYITHHSNQGCNTDRPYNPVSCSSCHSGGGGGGGCTSNRSKHICTDCHFHGSTAAGRVTF